jgi:hypothetical protein
VAASGHSPKMAVRGDARRCRARDRCGMSINPQKWFSRRRRSRRAKPVRPPVEQPARPVSARSWRYPPPLT